MSRLVPVAALAAMALWQAKQAGVSGPGALPDVLRGLAAALAVWGISGYALTRRWLPSALQPHWQLFVVPVGAMATGLAMTLLGFAAVPYRISLSLTLLTGTVAAAFELRRGSRASPPGASQDLSGGSPRSGSPEQGQRRGVPPDRSPESAWLRIVWPAYLAAIIVAIALVPVFRSGFATVVGEGSDAHLAAGSANFLKHDYPTSTDTDLPVDRVPLVWRSKFPIYYSLAAVSSVAGLDTVQTLSTMAALLLALAALGFYLLALHLLRAGPVASLTAMALVGLNAMVIFTVTHPYFNQTWGLVAMPSLFLFSWWAIREPRAGTVALALLFTAVGAFAYPLMMAFPAAGFAGYVFFTARERRREGRPIDWLAPLSGLPRAKGWIPLYALAGLLLAVPILGVAEKLASGFLVVVQGRTLAGWAGDIRNIIPLHRFFSLVGPGGQALTMVAVAAAAWVGLRDAPRAARRALLLVGLMAAWFANYFHYARDGQYFYFKTLAYLGPLVVTLAACGLGRAAGRGILWRRLGPALAVAYLVAASVGARDQLGRTFDQVTPRHRDLIAWDRELPSGSSVRLDVEPTKQIWVAYFLYHHPLSSRHPLLATSYPHVPTGRKADYVVGEVRDGRPADATGRPVFANADFALYRMRSSVPGRDRSSRRMVQTVNSIPLS